MPVARTPGRSPMAAGASEKRCIRHRAPSAACGGFRMPQLIDKDTGSTHVFLGPTRVPRVPKGFGAEVVVGVVEHIFSPTNSTLGNWLVSLPCVWCESFLHQGLHGLELPVPQTTSALEPSSPHPCSCGHSTLLGAEPRLCL